MCSSDEGAVCHNTNNPAMKFGPNHFKSQLPFLVVAVLLLGQLLEVAYSQQQPQQHDCPKECSCFDTFVSCDGFTESTLREIPENVQTLVLYRGTLDRGFPRYFLRRFPHLSFLEIQSTEVEAVVSGTFSGLKGMEHVALVDCNVGIVETGAFHDVQNMSRLLITDSRVGTVQPGAFSSLSDVGELIIESTRIDEVGRGAFQDLSNIGSFTFAFNNVTVFDEGAFRDVRRFGKVAMRQNDFRSFQASAVIPLMKASDEAEVVSNTVECQCGSVRAFRRPEMARFLQSQACTVPETGEVLKLSEVNVTELCLNDQPTIHPPTVSPQTADPTATSSSSRATGESDAGSFVQTRSSTVLTFSTTQTYPSSDASATSPSAVSHSTTHPFSSSMASSGKNPTETAPPVSSTFSQKAAGSYSSPSTLSRFTDVTTTTSDVTGSGMETTTTPNEKNQNSGLTDDFSELPNGAGAVPGTQVSVISFLAPCIVSWLVSLLVVRQQLWNTQ